MWLEIVFLSIWKNTIFASGVPLPLEAPLRLLYMLKTTNLGKNPGIYTSISLWRDMNIRIRKNNVYGIGIYGLEKEKFMLLYYM